MCYHNLKEKKKIYRHRHCMTTHIHIVVIVSHVPIGTAHVHPHAVVVVIHAVLGVIHMIHVIHFAETINQQVMENHSNYMSILTYVYKS